MSNRSPIRQDEILRPDRILNNIIKDYIDGVFDDYIVLHRASVVKIDYIGGQLEQSPPNPRNSIKARVITNARDKDLTTDELSVFWPMFPHDVMPIKENEHVYVLYEDTNKSHGLWLARISEPNTVNNVNLVPGSKKYEEDPNNDFTQIGLEKSVQDTDIAPDAVQTSSEFTVEDVAPLRPRIGDRVIEGSNNTAIVLGRDRPSDVDSGEQQTAGTIDIVTGRSTPENMNMDTDKSRIYISMNTDIDGNLSIDVGPPSGPTAAIGIKSDQIRIVARNGMKLLVEGGDIHIEGANIFIGDKAAQPIPLGDELKKYLETVVVSTPAGPGKLAPPPPTVFSKTVKVKA